MSQVIIAPSNWLETSNPTFSVADGSVAVNASYPASRLWDRSVKRKCITASGTNVGIRVDLLTVRALPQIVFAAGHNIVGLSVAIYRSTTGAVGSWGSPLAAVTAGAGAFALTPTGANSRYLLLTIYSATPKAFELTELWYFAPYAFERNPSRPAGVTPEYQVTTLDTSSGARRWRIDGPEKRRRRYSLPNISTAQRDNLLAALGTGWAGAKPFWLCDHEGAWIFGTLDEPLDVQEVTTGRHSVSFNFIESTA